MVVISVAVACASGGDATLASAPIPGRFPRELIQDSNGPIWLLAFDNTRLLPAIGLVPAGRGPGLERPGAHV